ncbi:MAG TPA: hypothetical protein VFB29_01525 [Pseudolabrys sp.]|nr:hypothetical protein [Pseudolabrys sp.]
MKCCREPSLEDILSDPIVKAVIDADGVDTNELNAMLRCVAHRRRSLERGAPLVARR